MAASLYGTTYCTKWQTAVFCCDSPLLALTADFVCLHGERAPVGAVALRVAAHLGHAVRVPRARHLHARVRVVELQRGGSLLPLVSIHAFIDNSSPFGLDCTPLRFDLLLR